MSARTSVFGVFKVLTLTLVASQVGCATAERFYYQAVTAKTTPIYVETTPAGADGRIKNGHAFKTPAVLILYSDKDAKVTLTKEGYQPVEIDLKSKISRWYWANLVFPVGFAFDTYHGADRVLRPQRVNVELQPIGTTLPGTFDEVPN